MQETYIIYASQKGTSKAIAEDFHEECISKDIKCNLLCISKIRISEFVAKNLFVFIAATTGDGDPPDTARDFLRKVQDFPNNSKKFYFSVLGLGDTNYTNFCNFGKTLDKSLCNIGGFRFYDSVWADDATGLEEVVDPFLEALLPLIMKRQKETMDNNFILKSDKFENSAAANKITNEIESTDKFPYEQLQHILANRNFPSKEVLLNNPLKCLDFPLDKSLTLPSYNSPCISVNLVNENGEEFNHTGPFPFSASDLLPCTINAYRYLSGKNACKSTLELRLALPSTSVIFEPGDSFSILPQNNELEVDLLLTVLGLENKSKYCCNTTLNEKSTKRNAKIPAHLHKKYTLKDIFTHVLDIRTVPKKALLRALVEHTSNADEKRRLSELASKEGTSSYTNNFRLNGITFMDMLLIFQSCKPPLSVIFEHLPMLLPRPYSVISSPLSSQEYLSFAFNIIDIKRDNYRVFDRKGICTGWLQNLCSSDLCKQLDGLKLNKSYVYAYLRANTSFRLPKDLNTPIIMVGPGTGVAPFIGFLNHRRNIKSGLGEAYLFFGCRTTDDFIYKSEMEEFKDTGILTKLFTCFSRENSDEKYVQDIIIKNVDDIGNMICNKGAVVYVCGEAKTMSKDVMNCFTDVVKMYLNIGEAEARDYIAQMQINKKYLQDVWS